MSRYQLIVFDWDGTLMDSTGHIVNCMQQAITRLALPSLEDSAISHIIGLGLNEAVQALYPEIDVETSEQLANTYREVWLTTPYETPLFDNAFNLVQYLSEQSYFLGVATGKSRRGLDKVLKSTSLGSFFHATRCADECHSKPHPQMLEEVMDFVGVSPKETLMIGDTEYDLQMANNAGADSLGISHGAHGVETLLACQPQEIVIDLHHAQQWLSNL
ncbi:MAG: HAD-IA family hydrolase [Gammaproteobacteria bacterium]|nr:HAD-IA family hydrolase [Gammaproteobacteria bacterium]MDH5592095.1 HAD-IA family hydrolase [Gammaproteobacteria bacterium]